jgi:hypothetical protein
MRRPRRCLARVDRVGRVPIREFLDHRLADPAPESEIALIADEKDVAVRQS